MGPVAGRKLPMAVHGPSLCQLDKFEIPLGKKVWLSVSEEVVALDIRSGPGDSNTKLQTIFSFQLSLFYSGASPRA